jgi:hypothetical protein
MYRTKDQHLLNKYAAPVSISVNLKAMIFSETQKRERADLQFVSVHSLRRIGEDQCIWRRPSSS